MPNDMRDARFNLDMMRAIRENRIKKIIKERSLKMGYRSTVAYTIRFTPFPSPQEAEKGEFPSDEDIKQCKESFYTFLAEAKLKLSGAVNDDGMRVDEGNLAFNFLAYDVKWYESYEDVKVHEDLVQLSKEWVDMENKHIGGIFMRIGEEMDDMVEEGWGEHDWDWMRIHRQIEVDWEEAR
jgi:hypothetical protein